MCVCAHVCVCGGRQTLETHNFQLRKTSLPSPDLGQVPQTQGGVAALQPVKVNPCDSTLASPGPYLWKPALPPTQAAGGSAVTPSPHAQARSQEGIGDKPS